MTTPGPVLPQIIVEAGLVPDAPGQGGTTLFLNDPVNGKLDTATLGTATGWTDLSSRVLGFTIARPSTRLQGPLWNYQPGTFSVRFDNSDGGLDPDNLAGPYVTGGTTNLVPMVPVRARAVFGSVAYPLYSGFADGWLPATVDYEGGYAELTVPATDAFKVLAGITLPAVTTEGVGADAGARVRDILTRAGWYTSAERNVISTGNSTLQGTTLGDTALNLMQIAADSEIGQLYVNGSGAVVFRARRDLLTDSRSNTVQATFGDLPGLPPGFSVGAFIGFENGWPDYNTNNPVWKSWTGVNIGVTRIYKSAGDFTYTAGMAQLAAAGVKICLSVSPAYNPVSSSDLASLTTLMQTLKAAGAQCDVAIWSEPYYSGLSAAQYTAAVNYYGPAIRQYYPLVFVTSAFSVAANNENSYYPGDSAVDKVATDFYISGSSYGTLDAAASVADGAAPPKPFGIWEFGAATDPVNGSTQASVTAFFGYIQSYMAGRLQAGKANADVIYFSDNQANWLGNGAGQDAGFEGGTGHWAQTGNCTIAATTAQARSGAYSMAVTCTSASGFMQAGANTAYASNMPVTPGQTVYAFAWFRAATAARNCQVTVTWFSSGGTNLSTSFGTAIADVTSAWTQATAVFTAPASAAYAQAGIYIASPALNEVHYADDVSIAVVPATSDLASMIEFGWDYRLPLWTALYAALTAAELPCAAISRASDDTTIANDIQATRTNGGTMQEVKDTASIAKYLFPRTYSRADLILQNDSDCLNWAQWVLYVSRGGEDRFETLAVDPAADPANLWPQVLGRDIGDRIQARTRPAGVAAPVTKNLFISGITHAWDTASSAWLTTWTLMDASKYGSFLTLDNATLGRLDSNALIY